MTPTKRRILLEHRRRRFGHAPVRGLPGLTIAKIRRALALMDQCACEAAPPPEGTATGPRAAGEGGSGGPSGS